MRLLESETFRNDGRNASTSLVKCRSVGKACRIVYLATSRPGEAAGALTEVPRTRSAGKVARVTTTLERISHDTDSYASDRYRFYRLRGNRSGCTNWADRAAG